MGAIAFWTARLIVGFLGVLLWGESARAALTVFCVLFFEFFGFLVLVLPGSSTLQAVQLHAGVGLILGLGFCISKQRPSIWRLPLLAASVLLVLRASWLFDADWSDFRAIAPIHAATVVGLPLGMLAAIALVDGALRLLGRARRSA